MEESVIFGNGLEWKRLTLSLKLAAVMGCSVAYHVAN